MEDKKIVIIRLFFNKSNMRFYILIGEVLCAIKDTVAGEIQTKNRLHILHVADIDEMRKICNEN